MKNYINWPIAKQIIAASSALVICSFLVVTIVLSSSTRSRVIEEMDDELLKDVSLMAKTLDSYFENVRNRGEREFNVLRELLGEDPTITSTKTMTGEVELPTLKVAGEVINGNHRFLERFQKLVGSDAAFLVVHDGKLYRASTLLKSAGKSVDGVPLPSEDPVAKAVLSGNDYSGMTVRNGQYFFSFVRALKGQEGKPFGAISVRISIQKELEQIRQNFADMRSGKTGYAYVMRPTGDDQIADFVVHPNFAGKTVVSTITDGETISAIKAILAKGQGIFHYQLRNGQGNLEEKVVAISKSEPWKWVVVFGTWTDEYMDGVRSSRNSILVVGAIASLITAVILGIIIRARLADLVPAVDAIRKLGAGDLTVSYRGNGTKNEVGQLGDAIGLTLNHMRQLVSEVANTSSALSRSAVQVESRAQQLAAGAHQQFSSASSMAAAVEELSVSISHVADSAQQSASLSTAACDATNEGKKVVDNAINEMRTIASRIGESAHSVEELVAQSESISNVVQVIREIAAQTNLLALNAAIEAARAGEQGRGFAVVADEVRKLAERTSTSTHEISSTIGAIVSGTQQAVEQMIAVRARVSESVRLAEETGQALMVIDDRNQQTLSIANDIASGTREQSSTSQDLARTVEQIAQSSELTAESASENQAAAHQLLELADGLQHSLREFKI